MLVSYPARRIKYNKAHFNSDWVVCDEISSTWPPAQISEEGGGGGGGGGGGVCDCSFGNEDDKI